MYIKKFDEYVNEEMNSSDNDENLSENTTDDSQEHTESIVKNVDKYAKNNDLKWEYASDMSVDQMDHDKDKSATLYINKDTEATVGVYCLDGKWFVHLESPYTQKPRVEEIDSFESGVEFLKKFLHLDKVECLNPVKENESTEQNDELYEREFSKEQREALAKEGKALPDGSFPINSKKDLKNAIKSYGRASDTKEVKKHIIKRAKEMGETDLIPDDWK